MITGHCGPNAMQTLSAAGVQVYVGQAGSVQGLVDKFKNGQLTPTTEANASAHAGMGGKGMGRGQGMGRGRGMGRGQRHGARSEALVARSGAMGSKALRVGDLQGSGLIRVRLYESQGERENETGGHFTN